MKDEIAETVMTEFVALRAKMHAYKNIEKIEGQVLQRYKKVCGR